MFITRLKLYKSKRLAFNGIQLLDYQPEHIQQIILGTNGCGKSSLMAELSPLPARNGNYYKGGYKEIHITHRGKKFILLSDFSHKTSGFHSFRVDRGDGEYVEKNDGGTISIQEVLVKDYFNLDQETFDILIGQRTFREMSPNSRRNLLVKMSNDDMDYAIALYQNVQKSLRDANAVVKYLSDGLAKETDKIPNLHPRRQTLLKQQERLKEQHRALMKLSTDDAVYPEVHRQLIVDKLAELETLYNSVDTRFGVTSTKYDLKHANLDSLESGVLAKQAEYQRQLEGYKVEYDEINHTLDLLTKQGNEDKETILANNEKALREIDRLTGEIRQFPQLRQFTDITAILQTLDSVGDVLSDIISRLPDNSQQTYTKEQREEYELKKRQLVSEHQLLLEMIQKGEHIKEHLLTGDKVTCPECGHAFIPGMEKYNLTKVQDKLKVIYEQSEAMGKEIAIVDEWLAGYQEYVSVYRELKSLITSNKQMDVLWQCLGDYPLTRYHPNKYLSLYQVFGKEVLVMRDILALQEQITLANEALSNLALLHGSKEQHNEDTLSKLADKIADVNYELRLCDDDLAIIRGAKIIKGYISDTYKKLDSLVDTCNQAMIDYLNEGMMQFVNKEIDQVSVQLGMIHQELTVLEKSKDVIDELTGRLTEAKTKQEELAILAKELSPVNGLIADYSMRFINGFTDQLNGIINHIWTYDLRVMPLGGKDEELTYKFPLYMGDSDTQTPDIDNASTAQKGVIDFAFKVLFMSYMGFEDYPLYLDELTPNLDETHRIKIIEYVKNFVSAGYCSQLFMISHLVSGHNHFRDAQFLVINDSNLLNKPDEYNTHVEMTYETS